MVVGQRPLAAPLCDSVSERADRESVDRGDQGRERVIGVGADGHEVEVEVEGEPAGGACVELAQRRAAFERERLEDPGSVEVAQEEILGNVNNRGIAALSPGTRRGVAGDVPDGEADLAHVAGVRVRGSKGSRVSAICQAAS